MADNGRPVPRTVDFATGKKVPLVGPEENRQSVEVFLVKNRGYDKKDIEINIPISFVVKNAPHHSRVDLTVNLNGIRVMLFKCVAGAVGSWEREALSAARILETYQIPFAIVSDGKEASVMETLSGKKKGTSLTDIPAKSEALAYLKNFSPEALPPDRLEKERLIFRTYDTMNVNVIRDD